ncbi:hypothetical protein AB4342_14415, partial [Vibrio breoganii]
LLSEIGDKYQISRKGFTKAMDGLKASNPNLITWELLGYQYLVSLIRGGNTVTSCAKDLKCLGCCDAGLNQ